MLSRKSVIEFQSTYADMSFTNYKAVRFERMMPLFHLYRGVQHIQFTNIVAVLSIGAQSS